MKTIFKFFAALIIGSLLSTVNIFGQSYSGGVEAFSELKRHIEPTTEMMQILERNKLIGSPVAGCCRVGATSCCVQLPQIPQELDFLLDLDELTAHAILDMAMERLNLYFYESLTNEQVDEILSQGFLELPNDIWLQDAETLSSLGLTEPIRLRKGTYHFSPEIKLAIISGTAEGVYTLSIPYTYTSPVYFVNGVSHYHEWFLSNGTAWNDVEHTLAQYEIWSVPKIYAYEPAIRLFFFRNDLTEVQQMQFDYILANGFYLIHECVVIDDYYVMNELKLVEGTIIPAGHYEIQRILADGYDGFFVTLPLY